MSTERTEITATVVNNGRESVVFHSVEPREMSAGDIMRELHKWAVDLSKVRITIIRG